MQAKKQSLRSGNANEVGRSAHIIPTAPLMNRGNPIRSSAGLTGVRTGEDLESTEQDEGSSWIEEDTN